MKHTYNIAIDIPNIIKTSILNILTDRASHFDFIIMGLFTLIVGLLFLIISHIAYIIIVEYQPPTTNKKKSRHKKRSNKHDP